MIFLSTALGISDIFVKPVLEFHLFLWEKNYLPSVGGRILSGIAQCSGQDSGAKSRYMQLNKIHERDKRIDPLSISHDTPACLRWVLNRKPSSVAYYFATELFFSHIGPIKMHYGICDMGYLDEVTNLCHLFSVGFGVEWGLGEEYRVFFWGYTQLIVECVMPDLLHIVPVGNDTVLDGIFQGEDTSLTLCFITDVAVFLAHTDHHTLKWFNDFIKKMESTL